MSTTGNTANEAAATPAPTTPRPMPADNEEFDLTINPIAPLKMVENDGYSDYKKWQFHGHEIKVSQTRRFKWVAVGYCRNLDEVREKLEPHGSIPGGQWREAVKATFQPDGQHPRGIADPSWESPDGRRRFPCVGEDGDSDFFWAGRARREYWRWLVEVQGK